MKKTFLLLVSLILLAFCNYSCSKDPVSSTDNTQKDSVAVYKCSTPIYVFGFAGQKRYSYCPSVVAVDGGMRHVFFCGNPNQGVMVDNIYHIVESPDGSHTTAVSVLQPSLEWDSHHTCDPSVIEGAFKFDGETYKYALFFLSNPLGHYYNEIGVAFSNSLSATSWKKYPYQVVSKTWPEDGDQSVGNGNSWGVGQPSAVSLDKAGKVLLTYTIGDREGTRIEFRQMDLSDMSSPDFGASVKMTIAGLDNLSGAQDYTCNADFAVNQAKNKIVMVRPVQPHPTTYPTYIPVAQEVDYMDLDSFLLGVGKWKALTRIDENVSGFPRNHNAALMRDSFGHVDSWEEPTVYFTVSKQTPDVDASKGNHAEWTYHIYRTSISKSFRYFDKK